MHPLLNFAEFIINGLLELMVWVVIAWAILSWLVAFNVVNMRNQAVWQISRGLDAVARPIIRPFQRIIPPLGGMDISPVILILVVGGVQRYLLPALFEFLHGLAPGGPVL